MSKIQFKSNLPAIFAVMRQAGRETVNETAVAIAADAKANAPKDTSAMANTVVALLEGRNNSAAQSAAEGKASAVRPDISFNSGLELLDGSKEGIHRSAVEVLADYAPLIHNGFGGRAARPFLEEAGEGQRDEAQQRLGKKLNAKFD